MACYKSGGCPYPGRPCGMCECSNPNYKQEHPLRKHVVCYHWRNYDGESGFDNYIYSTNTDAYTEREIYRMKDDINSRHGYRICDCTILNIIPLND